MSIFSRDADSSPKDDGTMFGAASRNEEKQRKMERAKEIASGLTTGFMERDEEVWELVRELEEKGSK